MTVTAVHQPLVSVAMPVRNGEQTVGLAIESILRQTYAHWELLIVDDGSTDETLRILRGYQDRRIRVWTDRSTRGRPFRRNQTIELSNGALYACMDSDDIAYPRRLEKQVAYLQQHPTVDLVGGGMVVFRSDGEVFGKRLGAEQHEAIVARPIGGIPMAQPTFMGRVDFFRRYMYRTALPVAEDQDLLLRSFRHSTFANVPEILVGYREAAPDLKKLLPQRYFLSGSLWQTFRAEKRYDLAAKAVAEQGLKSILDVVAVGSGLNYRVLRHRASPLAPAERTEWESLWTALHGQAPKPRGEPVVTGE